MHTLKILTAAAAIVGLAFAGSAFAEDPAPTEPAPDAPAALTDDAEAEATFTHNAETYDVLAVAAVEDKSTISVTPHAGFKINTQYPWKFKVGAEGETVYKRDSFELADGLGSLTLPATEAAGTLYFSVCSESSCLIEKVEVTAAK